MDLKYGFNEFIPSKTYLGKRISSKFVTSVKNVINNISNEDELSAYLKKKFK
jgi:hypothetical protein